MRHPCLFWCIGSILGALSLSDPVAAQGRFQVPEGCGSEAEFQSEFERLTASTGPRSRPDALLIEALVAEPGGYELRLVLGQEQRVLRDPDCRVLFRSAIVISAAASAEHVVSEAPPGPASASAPPASAAPSVSPPAQPSTVPPSPPASSALPVTRTPAAPARAAQARGGAVRQSAQRPRQASPRAAQRRAGRGPERPRAVTRETSRGAPSLDPPRGTSPSNSRFAIDLGLGVSGGVLPDLGSVLELGVRVEHWPWALELATRYWPERSGSREGRGVDVSALGGRVAGLFRVAPALNMLLGLELDRLEGTGSESVLGRHTDAAWQLAPTLGLNLITWDIRYLRLEIGVAGRVSVLRPRFVVTGFGDLYRVPLLGADAIIRGVWLFP